ncbi:hypothetical protein CDAR_195671, partial [Caerostris darwini]
MLFYKPEHLIILEHLSQASQTKRNDINKKKYATPFIEKIVESFVTSPQPMEETHEVSQVQISSVTSHGCLNDSA